MALTHKFPRKMIVNYSNPAEGLRVLVRALEVMQNEIVKNQFIGAERSADPDAPNEGEFVIWMSDGTGKGSDGDVLIASTAGGTTKYSTLFDHSAGSAW